MTFFRPTFSSPGKHSLVFSHSSCETRHTDICWYNILLSLTQYLQHGDGHHIKGSTVIQKHSLNWATVHVHSDVEGFEVLGHFLTCFSNKILLDFTGSGSFSGCCSTVWVPWCALPGLAPVSTGSAAAYCACCSTSSVLAWKRKGNPEWEHNLEKNQNGYPHLHNPDLHHRNHRSGHCPVQVGIQL